MPIRNLNTPVTLEELRRLAADQFGDFVKAVVDVGRGVMAIGGELHADEEATLLDEGARRADLWGINLYPDRPVAEMVEFDSMINVRPSQRIDRGESRTRLSGARSRSSSRGWSFGER